MPAKLSKLNQSVEKSLQIIEILAKERSPMRLQDIAAACGMPASTVLRMLNTLLVYGYINQDPVSLQYSLSLKFAQIGSVVCETVSLRDIAHPFLVKLSRSCSESSCLAVEENMEVVYTDVQDGPDNMLKIMQRIGKRAPMHATGIGKLLLLNYDNKAIDRYIKEKGLPVLSPNTLTTKKALLEELERIRKQGYAMDNEECELGARCVAAPIRDYTGRIVAGISVSGPLSRLPMTDIEKVAPLVVETAEDISKLLAYDAKAAGKE
ncbi:IclR family transcriptional regulator [Vermiculatibacterium agrestimuris]|uniref:IclR family transcriptional regulator n=1 Tax=Vermiculatibacterium agrestimuris TaxID=2941519 RepID=UPI00203F8B8B|nr:IclR family transcriptional regulator [Vermiculatibacterium agrestimuris]